MRNKRIYIFKEENNRPIIGRTNNGEYENTYASLNIPDSLKQQLKEKIFSEEAFEVSKEDMKTLKQAFYKKIEELVEHPDFNPFKELLREQYPKQFGNEPFKFNGITYYLYNKGSDFYIDHKIRDF
ncbi:hypothetical protein, partial [Lacinutrix salivirga]